MRTATLFTLVGPIIGLLAVVPVTANACSPPAPLPLPVLNARADAIVVGAGEFSSAAGGGRLVSLVVVKGAKRARYPIRISYRWAGPPSARCPPVNALVGHREGTFYLSASDSAKFTILAFYPR